MIFGLKEKKAALGQFTSEKCTSCKESNKYIFYRITKFVVLFFIKLIPVSNRYEGVCTDCEDTVQIDKTAGKKIAKQKFAVENSNQNFLIFIKLFVAALVIAAAVVLPIIIVGPPMSPQLMKDLVDEPGDYTIVNKDDTILAIVSVSEDSKELLYYTDISSYKAYDGNSYKLHKFYKEEASDEGSVMKPIVDDFAHLVDSNKVKVQRYYYDIANDSYGFAIGISDLNSIERSDSKTVYPLTYSVSDDVVYNYKLIIYYNEKWEIDVRFDVADDGTENLIDILMLAKDNGRIVSKTMYYPNAKDGSLVYVGSLSSDSTDQDYYDFITSNDLEISYVDTYTYYDDTNIRINSKTTTTDANGNTSVMEEKYDVVKKYNYYILKEIN